MTLTDLRQLCVTAFPLSTTRPRIMEGLEGIIDRLLSDEVHGEVWVNGSFVTLKVNPEDADLVLRCSAEFYDGCTPQQRNSVDCLASNLRQTYLCDSYCFMEWPIGHANYWTGQYMHSYCMKQFGFSRGDAFKGIAVIALLGGTL